MLADRFAMPGGGKSTNYPLRTSEAFLPSRL